MLSEQFYVRLRWPKEAVSRYVELHNEALERDALYADYDENPEISWEYQITEEGSLNLYADEYFDVDCLSQAILHILTEYDLPAVAIEWARLGDHDWYNETGGGAVWISRHTGYEVFTTEAWTDSMRRAERVHGVDSQEETGGRD